MVAQSVWTWDAVVASVRTSASYQIMQMYADFVAHPEWEIGGCASAQLTALLNNYNYWLTDHGSARHYATLDLAWQDGTFKISPETQDFVYHGQTSTVAPAPTPPPPVQGFNPFSTIRDWFAWATQAMVSAALVCYGHWPLDLLGDVFNSLSDWTAAVAGEFWSLANWYDATVEQLARILTWDAIRASIESWLPGLPGAVSWWSSWWQNVNSVVTYWWSVEVSVVRGWIDQARADAIATLGTALTFDWLGAWWGNTTTSFADWWTGARAGVLEAVEIVVKPVRDQANENTGVLQLLTDPGDTALRWLLDRITTAIVRLW